MSLANIRKQNQAQEIADEFVSYMAEFHSYAQPYDDAMDAEFYEQYARVLREQSKWGYFNWKTAPDGTPRPLFSPSSAGNSERELYEKVRRSKKDESNPTPNQRDWTGLGSAVGGYLQREIMLAERHFKKLTGKEPRFRFERTERNEPAFEHFKKTIHEVEYDGEKFGLNGLPDGILLYTTDDGEVLRVGLEVKSFQKSWTDFKKLADPKQAHVDQTIVYSEMYGLDYYIVLYHLTYGYDWFREDVERNKAFGKYISQAERDTVLEKFARVTKAAREGIAPPLDLTTFRFNDYKTAISQNLSDEEYEAIRQQVEQVKRSRLPDYKKRGYIEALDFIDSVRGSKEAG